MWGALVVWVLLGAAADLGTIPVAALAILVWTRPQARRSAFGLLTGAGVLLLYVTGVQRDGPGTTCWHSATGGGCDQHLNPLPWLVIGIALCVAGVVAQARRR